MKTAAKPSPVACPRVCLQLGLDAQPWARLDDRQRAAATYLGYTQDGWNAELDDPSIAEVAAATGGGGGDDGVSTPAICRCL